MTTDDEQMWPPALFAKQWQEAGEDVVEQQTKLFRQFLSLNSGSGMDPLSQLGAMSMGVATFKTRVQSGGRISIPDAEREALDINEGDIVQSIVIPLKRKRSDANE